MADELLVKRLGVPKAETDARYARRTGAVPRLFVEGQRPPTSFRCASGNRAGDGVSYSKTPGNQYVVRFSCASPGPSAASRITDYTVVMDAGVSGPLADGRGPRRLSRTEAPLAAKTSRAYVELSACLDMFDKYRGGDFAWEVTTLGNYPRCKAVPSGAMWIGKNMTNVAVDPAKANAPIGVQMLERDLIANQQPQGLSSHFYDRIDNILGYHGLADLTNGWLQPNKASSGAVVPVGGSKGLNITFTGSRDWAFLTLDKPFYGSVVLQLIERKAVASPIPAKLSPLSGKAATLTAAGIEVSPATLQAKLGVAAACETVMAPKNLAGIAILPIKSEKITQNQGYVWAVGGPVWLSTFSLTSQQYDQLLGGRTSGDYWLRVVPASPPKAKTAYVPDCAGPPGDLIPVKVGVDPAATVTAIATYDKIEQTKLNEEAKAAAVQAAAALPGGPKGSAPATIEVVGWLPPDDVGAFVMTEIPFINDSVAGITAEQYVNQPHVSKFLLRQAYPDAVWPDRFNGNDGPLWVAGGLYAPYEFERAAKADQAIDDWYDYLFAGINMYSATYSLMVKGVVDGLTYAVSGGQCEPTFPGQQPPPSPAACKVGKAIAQTGVSIGMSALGLPPQLPTTVGLAEQASQFMVSYAFSSVLAADPSLAAIPFTASAQAATTNWVTGLVKQRVLGMKCAEPVSLDSSPQAQGFEAVDPVTLCGYRRGSLTTWGRVEKLATTPLSATLFLRIKPNPARVAEADTKITIWTNSSQVKPAPGWESAFKHVGYGFQPLKMAKPITIDVETIPPEGIILPIVYAYPEELMYWAYRQSGSCPDSLFVSCWIEGARAFWLDQLFSGTQQLKISASYQFGEPVKKTSTSANGTNLNAFAPAIATFSVGELAGSLGKVYPGLTYGIKAFDVVEPGFRKTNRMSKTGLPTYEVEAAFDMEEEY